MNCFTSQETFLELEPPLVENYNNISRKTWGLERYNVHDPHGCPPGYHDKSSVLRLEPVSQRGTLEQA